MNPYASSFGGEISISDSARQTKAAESTARSAMVTAFAGIVGAFGGAIAAVAAILTLVVTLLQNSDGPINPRPSGKSPLAQIANPGNQSPGSANNASPPAHTEDGGQGSPVSPPSLEPPTDAQVPSESVREIPQPALVAPPQNETPPQNDSGWRRGQSEQSNQNLKPFQVSNGTSIVPTSDGRIFVQNGQGQTVRELESGEAQFVHYQKFFWPER